MKKSATGAWSSSPAAAAPWGPATRINPSPPTPNRRSHRAATSSPERWIWSCGSSTITKSFPVPWYLAKWSLVMGTHSVGAATGDGGREIGSQVLHDLLYDRGRPPWSRPEPPDAGVSAEPCHLPSSEGPGPADGGRDGLLQGALPRHVAGHLSVPDGL